MKTALSALLVSGLLATGCGSSSSPPTTPTTTATTGVTTEIYSGSLAPQAQGTYTFAVASATPVNISLVSLTTGTGTIVGGPLNLWTGTPNGDTCTPTITPVSAGPSLTTQISNASMAVGIYCVGISDPGNLAATANFVVRINQGSPTGTATTVEETVASVFGIGGSYSRSFTVSQGGTITATLITLSPDVTVRMGLGVPGATGTDCAINTFVDAQAASSPQITVTGDPGYYCVKLWDIGNLTAAGINFSLIVDHPS